MAQTVGRNSGTIRCDHWVNATYDNGSLPSIPATPPIKEHGLADHIAIVGSRSYPRPDVVEAFVAGLPAGAVVVSGGAPGVDSIAEHAAKARGLDVAVFRADWGRHGRKAGPMRNAVIVASADQVVAFWDGGSRGTLNTVVQAARAGRPVEVFDAEGRPVPIEEALRIAEERGVMAAIDAAG